MGPGSRLLPLSHFPTFSPASYKSNLHLHIIPLQHYFVTAHALAGGRQQHHASGQVEGRAVPRTAHRRALHETLRERPAGVWTNVVDGVKGALHVEQGDALAEDRSEERRVGKECRSRW